MVCFKSVKTIGALHSQTWKWLRPAASSFFTTKNVELLGLHSIHKLDIVLVITQFISIQVI